jgi:RND family efflux transporter MFP subunit
MFVLLVAVVGGTSWWIGRDKTAHEDDTLGGPSATDAAEGSTANAPRVDVVHPRTGGLVRQTSQPGSIHAFESVDIYAKVSGFLKVQEVDIGAVVKRGDVLAVIDAPELEKDIEETAAAVEQSKARATLAEARVATAEAEREAVAATIAQAEADIAQQVAKRSLAEKQHERIKDLYARDAVQKGLVDEHEQNMEAARAGERSARASALMAKAQLAAAEAKVLQAKADLAEARTAIRLAEARTGRTRVINDYARLVAPFDGVITARNFHPGAFIRSATEGSGLPLLTVMRTDRMRVVVQVPDLDVALLDVGDPATVVIDAIKGRSFSGSVSRVARAENPTTRTMRVEIDLENPSGLLCEGMYGRATIELRPPSKGLSLPANCVIGHSAKGQAKVYVVREGHVHPAAVTVGDDDGSTMEILSGLGPEDSVVLNPRGINEDGAPVVANLIPTADRPH